LPKRSWPKFIGTFLLTSRTEPAPIIEHIRRCGTNTVQLVDGVGENVYQDLRRELPDIRIVQVVHVTGDAAVEEARRIAGRVDALLLDSGNPTLEVKELGGTGRTHDWNRSRQIVESVKCPVFLAGGLNPGNILDAVRQVQPYGVDICSGVRTEGRLDPLKLTDFFAAIRRLAS
jgi:phosphoribosylanthranilate isomerase